MITFCTLYNINYADKGLVLFDSLIATGCDFKLYVLAMDKKLEHILSEEKSDRLEVVSLEEVMKYEPALERLKEERTATEFCWSCSSVFIEYVLKTFSPEYCTYIDADMYFYSNPAFLIDDLDKPVGIMKHRYPKTKYYSLLNEYSGTYCVEFNPFKNDEMGLKVLTDWKNDCIEACDARNDQNGLGDQGYLDFWEEKYPDSIHIYDHPGAGIASWNLHDYDISEGKLSYLGEEIDPVFYHFSGIKYAADNSVTIIADAVSEEIVKYFYEPYLKVIEEKRVYLSTKYNVNLREIPKISSEEVRNEDREVFIAQISALLKKCKFITAIKKIIERKYISDYCRKFKYVTFRL